MYLSRLSESVLFGQGGAGNALARNSIVSGGVTAASQVFQFVLTMARTVILSRLLSPTDFGLLGMVAVVTGFVGMFKDAGLSVATVQQKEITSGQVSALFWLNSLLSLVLGALVAACSSAVSRFYGHDELFGITLALSVPFVLSGLQIQHQALLRRHLRFLELAVINSVSNVFSLLVAILAAHNGLGYWSLVYAIFAQSISSLFLHFYFCPWTPGLFKRGAGIGSMLQMGGHLTGFNMLTFFSRNLDNVLIGRCWGDESLGYYSRAYQLFMMPIAQMRSPVSAVALPVLSKLEGDSTRFARYYLSVVMLLAFATVPVGIYCFLRADLVVALALGEQWSEAVSIFRVLAVAGIIQAVAGTIGLVMTSCGFTKRFFKLGAASALVCSLSFLFGVRYGAFGVAVAFAVYTYLTFVPTMIYGFAKTPITVRMFLASFLPIILAGGGAAVIALGATCRFGDGGVKELVFFAIFVVTYLALSLLNCQLRGLCKTVLMSFPVLRKKLFGR